MINHHVFFEHLGTLDQDSPEWHSVTAGLVVLRLFDAWIEFGPHVVTTDMTGQQAVRAIIDTVPAGDSTKNILSSVVDAMCEMERVDVSIVGPRILAYGKALDYAGQWSLASDVFRTIVAHAHPIENSNLAIEANKQLGRAYRLLAQWELAGEAYRTAGNIAQRSGDIFNILWANIGCAKIDLAIGNLPQADSILGNTIEQASTYSLYDLKRMALHDRAGVAYRRNDLERAVRYAYEALDGQSSPSDRDRVLADLAIFFAELGVLSAARDTNLILAATAQEQVIRWNATNNLLQIAYKDGNEPIFEQYRKELGEASLPPELTAYYHFVVGRGYESFGHYDSAREVYQRTIVLATASKMNQLIFDAEAALSSLGKRERQEIKSKSYKEVSTEVSNIAEAIKHMRETVTL